MAFKQGKIESKKNEIASNKDLFQMKSVFDNERLCSITEFMNSVPSILFRPNRLHCEIRRKCIHCCGSRLPEEIRDGLQNVPKQRWKWACIAVNQDKNNQFLHDQDIDPIYFLP
jgi:hypothetical protein